jgi:hypothetical protein
VTGGSGSARPGLASVVARRHDPLDGAIGASDTREANIVEMLIGILLVVISAVLIVGIVRTVSANAPR